MKQDSLTLALDELDKYLIPKSLTLEVVICGAFAIQLHGFSRAFHTQDIDTLKQINSEELLDAIKTVGEKIGLGPRWLNDQASTVSIPDGTFERAKPIYKWQAIKAYVVDRRDLIKMKASAFSIRREETIKDWEDLILLKPNLEEIEAAIQFLRQMNSPPPGSPAKILKDFQETIDELKKIAG